MQRLLPAAVAALIASAAMVPGEARLMPATEKTPAISTGPTMVIGSPTPTAASTPTPGGSPHGNLLFGWPLSPRPALHRQFAQPRDHWAPGHRGVDLLAAVGQPVLSAGDGVVAFSGVIAGRGVVTVRHPDGLRTSYEPVEDRLRAGTIVHRGARIGVIAASAGHCAPLTCLHWGAITDQSYLDPLSLLGFGQPILLPLG